MTLKEVLEAKLKNVVDLQKIGEDNLAKLNEIGLDDELAEGFKVGLLSLVEAENSSSIVEKNKDAWHKATLKGFYDSLDSQIAEHESLLGDEEYSSTKDKHKALLSAYKQALADKQATIDELKQKVENGISDSDSKALLAAKDAEIAQLKSSYVPKEEAQAEKEELSKLKREIREINKISLEDQVLSSAIQSKLLDGIQVAPNLHKVLVLESVNQYLREAEFGIDKVRAELLLDPSTRRVIVRNKSNKEMSVVEDGKIVSVEDIVKSALVKTGLNVKKDDSFETIDVNRGGNQTNTKNNLSKLLNNF